MQCAEPLRQLERGVGATQCSRHTVNPSDVTQSLIGALALWLHVATGAITHHSPRLAIDTYIFRPSCCNSSRGTLNKFKAAVFKIKYWKPLLFHGHSLITSIPTPKQCTLDRLEPNLTAYFLCTNLLVLLKDFSPFP